MRAEPRLARDTSRPGRPATRLGALASIAAVAFFSLCSGGTQAQNAYIPNSGVGNVQVINTATNTVSGPPIPVGNTPQGVAVTPDGSEVYVTNFDDGTVSVINTATSMVPGAPIPVGTNPYGVAVTPDGSKAYIANNGDGTVSVINTATNTVSGSPIAVGTNPIGVAVTPDGSKAYVTNYGDGTVSVINTATNATSSINVAGSPYGVAVTPDGSKVYVANPAYPGSVSVIDTTTNAVITAIPFGIGSAPYGVVVTPDGSKVYVTNNAFGTVSVIDTATEAVVVQAIPVGYGNGASLPFGVAVTPDGSNVYVVNFRDATVSVIDTASNTALTGPNFPIPVIHLPIALGNFIGPPPPSVTGVSPPLGSDLGGMSVTVTGMRLTGATAVLFGTTPGTNIVVNSPTSLTVTAPAGSGIVDVTVSTLAGTSAITPADQFDYAFAAPALSSWALLLLAAGLALLACCAIGTMRAPGLPG
jgi:YVTN family beta-propeller protein